MRVLVTGGAGYIGSHTVVQLAAAGHEPVIVDSHVNSSPKVIPRLEELTGTTIEAHSFDLRDTDRTSALLADGRFDAVIHFAGLKAVGESSDIPLEYYDNNLGTTMALVAAMRQHDVRTLVFSSSATVYGPLAPVPYVESYEPLASNNPYGRTKARCRSRSSPTWPQRAPSRSGSCATSTRSAPTPRAGSARTHRAYRTT